MRPPLQALRRWEAEHRAAAAHRVVVALEEAEAFSAVGEVLWVALAASRAANREVAVMELAKAATMAMVSKEVPKSQRDGARSTSHSAPTCSRSSVGLKYLVLWGSPRTLCRCPV